MNDDIRNLLPRADGETWDDETPKESSNPPRLSINHQTVFEMWEGGVRDIMEISIESGYAPNYVRTLLRQRGYDLSPILGRPKEQDDAVILDYKAGLKIRQILKKHHISNNTLYNILEENNVNTRREEGTVFGRRTEFLDRAIELYVQGIPVKKISSETGIVPSVLYAELDSRGVPMRIRPDLQAPVIDRAVDMYIEGSKVDEIAMETGLSGPKLYQELDQRNVPLRRQPDMVDRTDTAVALYERGADIETIFKETSVGSQQLYRELKHRGVALRNGKRAQGANISLAFELYDKGESFLTIQRKAAITLLEMTEQLSKRGGSLRTGLPARRIQSSMEIAIQEYQDGIPDEDITIDTLVTKVQLLAELRKRGIELRP